MAKKKQAAPKRPRVTRADIVMPSDSGKTSEQLRQESAKAKMPQGPARRSVPRSALLIAGDVFQWRGNQDQLERQNHVYNLATALRNQRTPLEPLTVWPVDDKFYVIDGHHRLAAYDTAKWNKTIPVEVFAGTLDQARLRALEGNIKDKLRMTTAQKGASAWTITKENIGSLTADQVAEHADISRRLAFSMKQVWKELNERTDLSEDQREKLHGMTWKQARDFRDGIRDDDDFDQDEWKAKKADAIVKLIRDHNVEVSLLQDPEVTALALQMLNGRLPEMLIEQWAGDYPELIMQLAGRLPDPEGPDMPF